jgi:hypothetical protein
MNRDIVLKYIIHEEKTGTTVYTFEDKETHALLDISSTELTEKLDIDDATLIRMELEHKPKRISVWNKSNTGGKLVQGLNDLYTYCMKNDKLKWLECYNAANNELSPSEIAWSSGKTINIHCNECNIDRKITLNTYLSQSAYCVCKASIVPYCIPGINDLYTYCTKNGFEYILDEYNGDKDLHTISYGTDKKLPWKCKYGHTWDATASARISKNEGCPYCKGSQTSKAERLAVNWLKENNINIIEREKIQGQEFDIHIVDYNILIEFNSDTTHGSEEQRRKDSLKHDIAKSIGCKLIVVMQNCYPTFDDTLYYDILFKYNSAKASNKMIDELCNKLNQLGVNIKNNISNNAKALSNKNEVPFERSMKGKYEGIEQIWGESNTVTPDRVFANTRQFIYLKCNEHNAEYSLRGDSLKQSWNKEGKGCPYCRGFKVIPGQTDLATLRHDLKAEWDEDNTLKPEEVALHSNKFVNWKCSKCGHKWNAMINNRTGYYKEGCPACAGKAVCNNIEDVIDNYDF